VDRSASRFGVALRRPTQDLIERLDEDARVAGVLLRGSAALGRSVPTSDDDLIVVLGECDQQSIGRSDRRLAITVPRGPGTVVVSDVVIRTIDELEELERSCADTDRWPFEQARLITSRDPRLTTLLRRLVSMDAQFREERLVHALLDVVIAVDQARRCSARGSTAEERLIVVRGARALCRALFALEWRWVPLDQWTTYGLSTLLDRANCSSLIAEALQEQSWRPLLVAERRLRQVLPELVPSRAWNREALWSVMRGPDARRQRALHGLC